MKSGLHNFWFKDIDARQYAALRIAFGGLSAVYFVELLPYVEPQFSNTSWLGTTRQIEAQNGGSWSLFFLDMGRFSGLFAYTVVITAILSSILLMLGCYSRMSACVTWLIWVSVWNRNPLLLDGDDAVLKIMCFYLMLSPCGNSWSVDAFRNPKPKSVPVWPLRLVQFQIALIYFVSGWVKFHSPEWLDGSIIRYVAIHPHYSRWDGWAVIDMPIMKELLAALAWFIRWWELLFPLSLIHPFTRRLTIGIGIAFHLGLLFALNLRWFAVIMPALYLALISGDCFDRFEKAVGNCFRFISTRRNKA